MNQDYDPDCPLCKMEIKTKLYYEDDTIIVVDCSTHLIPMIVLRRHTRIPTDEELKYVNQKADELFPGKRWVASSNNPNASVPQHFHLHSC